MKGKGFSPTHSELWSCCKHLLKHGNSVKRGGFHFHMASMLFAYLSYEAYLNFIGQYVAPDEWKDERKYFGSSDYRGTKGKFKLLQEKLGLEINKDREPYNTVACLEEFREFVSHGKPEDYKVTNASVRRDPVFPFAGKLNEWVKSERAEKSKKAVYELCCLIHEKAKAFIGKGKLGQGPFSAVEQVEWVG